MEEKKKKKQRKGGKGRKEKRKGPCARLDWSIRYYLHRYVPLVYVVYHGSVIPARLTRVDHLCLFSFGALIRDKGLYK